MSDTKFWDRWVTIVNRNHGTLTYDIRSGEAGTSVIEVALHLGSCSHKVQRPCAGSVGDGLKVRDLLLGDVLSQTHLASWSCTGMMWLPYL